MSQVPSLIHGTSTPVAGPAPRSIGQATESPIAREARIEAALEGEGSSFRFNHKARNVRARRLSFGAQPQMKVVPYEPPTKSVGWKWLEKLPAFFKFVDDGTLVTKINMAHAEVIQGQKVVRRKHDIATQNIFQRTTSKAEGKGMKVNIEKTQMLVISGATSYEPCAFIEAQDGSVIESSRDRIKVLGFYLDGTPSVAAHIDEVVMKVRRRLWVLRHLKSYGFNSVELVKVEP